MKKRPIVLLLLVTFSSILLAFISKQLADERPTVIVVLKDLNTDYWQIVKEGAEKGFRDFDINGKVIAPHEGSAEEQGKLLKVVLKENPDVLVVSPHYPDFIIPILERFVKKNIPVMLLDTDDPWVNKTSYIGTDNFDLGRKAGALLASELQPGNKVALIGGDVESPVGGGRLQGAKSSLKAAGIIVATEIANLANEFDVIKETVESILTDHPDIKGIIATNDTMALYALQVIEKEGVTIPVTGADGMNEMIELIEEGTLPGSVAQNPYDMGYISVEIVRKVIEGEKVERNIDSGVDIIIKGNAKQRLDFQKKLLR
ncbi:sugar ABC transporter substrate-binding protein [Halalkalibacter lacteus]|uniref:sugar ABC transporter substrate-binding protein n=1 Tax=Halalkalibacter lacteus TaxID=3090663 RepID=UPI002FC68E37